MGVSSDAVEMAMCEMYINYFNKMRENIDNAQLAVQQASPFSELGRDDQKRVGNNVVSVMPTWLYFETMKGTKDKHFWQDPTNRKKFLQENPQYAVKNFRKR